MYTLDYIKEILKNKKEKKRIIFPEGEEEKIQKVATYLVENDLCEPILLFKDNVNSNLSKKIKQISINSLDLNLYAKDLFDLRKGKLKSIDEALMYVGKANYLANMMLYKNEGDCILCGLSYTTADTLRPALQIIKTKPDVSVASSIIIMKKGENCYFFGDCSLNLNPSSQELADITKSFVNFAIKMGLKDPTVSLLSYSTNGSGLGPDVDKVKNAVDLLLKENVNFKLDGEIQFDAAFCKEVRDKKYKNSLNKNESADIFVFPTLDAGNIGYKIAQRMGGYEAIGPIILGLNKPVNDLSRGATLIDIIQAAVLTVYMAI
ncbi:phosphate acetyltransferase [Spiroplasma turonicum]|uniref:Phosphate acetyltransferase n=1 Tax=Spiroplasma turonicum TaxID=216946 RepID=A0A0K1P8V4_9MOLU|nr:phosphate acetyltransferase [Spiroplasma turonicum]AKU80327.1 Phosphate acetyltransferase [Spiroplasma turonicum]ALX71328.1 phosphotransacetylase [Spiroplasma turonicum]